MRALNKIPAGITPIFIIFLCVSTFAQSAGTVSAPISITVVNGLNVSVVKGDLNFGEILQSGTFVNAQKTPADGVQLLVNGYPDRNVVLEYNSVSLSNQAWSTIHSGSEGTLNFTPQVEHTNLNSNYSSATPVTSGSSYKLENSNGYGLLYLWIGGQLAIPETQPQGDYAGTFTVTVSY